VNWKAKAIKFHFLLLFFFFAAFFAFGRIGLLQHQIVVEELPQQPITISLPQGTQTSFWPFLGLAILIASLSKVLSRRDKTAAFRPRMEAWSGFLPAPYGI
jgi:RsiW-degrading membrane proteinase PrsW (M82 family)